MRANCMVGVRRAVINSRHASWRRSGILAARCRLRPGDGAGAGAERCRQGARRSLGVHQRRPRQGLQHHAARPIRWRRAMRADFDRACAGKYPFVGPDRRAGRSRRTTSCGWSIPAAARCWSFPRWRAASTRRRCPAKASCSSRRPRAAGPQPRTAEEISGEWTIVRGAGKPICSLTLTNIAAGEDFAVRVGRRAMPSSPGSARPPGRSSAANCCSSPRRASRGASRKSTPPHGSACPRSPIRSCWCANSAHCVHAARLR